MTTNQQRERLASAVHDSWSHWMRHIFSKSSCNSDGSWTIAAKSAERWRRQMETPYENLSETEKESDRVQVDRLMAAIDGAAFDLENKQ